MRLLSVTFLLLVISSAALAQTARVTIIHVNDIYQFMPVEGGKRGGLARLMTLKKRTLAENPDTIMTLGGDTLSPSVETRTYRGAQMIDAWNTVGLDYSVLGNHEFDIKTTELLARIGESKFTWLGANVRDARTGRLFADLPPYVIRDFGGIKIGILGILLPETKQTSSMDASLEVTDICETARKYVPEIRSKGAHAVIGLTHLSMTEDKQLTGCAEFDVILGGHEHSLLQSSANGTPIFKMTADAREAAKVHMNFDSKTRKLTSIDWEVVSITDAMPDHPDFSPVVAKYKDLLDKLSVPVGATGVMLDALSVSGRTKETNVGNFIADAYREAAGADVALVNGGSIRADLIYYPGPLTMRDVLSLLPFNNPIVKIEISGKTLREAVEHGVARSAVGEDSEPGRFPQVSGMSFKYDTTKAAGSRVTELLVGGRPIEEAKMYTLATSDFLVSRSGDGYVMFKNGRVLISAENAQKDSDVFEKAIRNSPNSTIAPKVEGRIVRLK